MILLGRATAGAMMGDAVGDAAAVRQGWGEIHGTCQSGIPTGAHAADNVARLIAGRAAKPFRFGYIHQPVSLGRHDAVIQFTKPDDSPRRWYLTGKRAVRYKELVTSSPPVTYRLPRRFTLDAAGGRDVPAGDRHAVRCRAGGPPGPRATAAPSSARATSASPRSVSGEIWPVPMPAMTQSSWSRARVSRRRASLGVACSPISTPLSDREISRPVGVYLTVGGQGREHGHTCHDRPGDDMRGGCRYRAFPALPRSTRTWARLPSAVWCRPALARAAASHCCRHVDRVRLGPGGRHSQGGQVGGVPGCRSAGERG